MAPRIASWALFVVAVASEVEAAQRFVSRRRAVGLPIEGSVAVVFRGETFRCGHESPRCSEIARDIQLNATGTFLANIVAPLEDAGNRVDIFLATSSCEANDLILALLGPRVKAHAFIPMRPEENQTTGVMDSLELFRTAAGAAASTYDLVFVVRPDLIWMRPLTSWTTDFSLFNFPGRCGAGGDPDCVSDTFYTMPGNAFGAFDTVASKVFKGKSGGHKTQGHSGKGLIIKQLGCVGIGWGFVSEFVPQWGIRAGDPYAGLIPSCEREAYDKFVGYWSSEAWK